MLEPPDAAQVARLVASQFPQWAGLPVTPVASAGTDNAMYRLGHALVVRLPRIPSAVADVDKEQRWLPQLAPALPLAVPVPLGLGAPDALFPHPWSVYPWFPGADAVAAPIVELDDAAGRLGRFVVALRRCPTDPEAPQSFRGVPVRTRDGEVRTEWAALGEAGLVDPDVVAAARDAVLAAPDWAGEPVWVHGDLHPANLLCTTGRLSAVIDFGGLGVGDPACDLLPAWTLLTAGTRAAFRTAAGVDEATWLRGRGWGLCFGLGALYHHRGTNPVLAAIGYRALSGAVADYLGTT
jgi:aminoglycoside phosphotransferase (APT) family kinase protein